MPRLIAEEINALNEALDDEYRETYFFLADFAPHDAARLAARLKAREILVKPLDDKHLGAGYMRVTTALPEDNARFLAALRELL